MKYMVVHLIKGEPAFFLKNMSNELANVFNLEIISQRIPPHLTLKAPFDARNISDLQKMIARFAEMHQPASVQYDGFGHFERRVIFMNVNPTPEANRLVEEFTAELKKIHWLSFSNNENRSHKRLHATIAYAETRKLFDELAKYLKDEKHAFDSSLDNIAILEKVKEKWTIHSEYPLRVQTNSAAQPVQPS